MADSNTVWGFDAFAPREIHDKVCNLGVTKAHLPVRSIFMLGMLAGAFIGLGALFYVIVLSDASLPFAVKRVMGGLVFSLGLFLVLVAGAELFTGNNLLAMAWAENCLTTREVLVNWMIVCTANFVGAVFLAWLVYMSGHTALNNGAIGQTYMQIATAKMSLPPLRAFFSGIMCNVLVCMAVWVALAGRSVTDKLLAIVLPISAFVAAGFEHSVANMFLIPLGMMLQADAGLPVDYFGLVRNLAPVIAGNIVGGSVLVALVYHVIYVKPRGVVPAAPAVVPAAPAVVPAAPAVVPAKAGTQAGSPPARG